MYEALLVERDNKDVTIKENEAHIDQLTESIRKLENEIEEIKFEKEKIKKEHVDKIKQLLQELEIQRNELTDLKLELEANSSNLLRAKEVCCDLENLLSEKELSLLRHKQEEEDLQLQINELKEKQRECHSDYELNLKELSDHCKILEEKVEELEFKDITRTDFEDQILKLREHIATLNDTNSNLKSKLNQKQQLILCLQGELSSSSLELEERKSENEKNIVDFWQEKMALIEKHNSEMEEKTNALEDLKKILAEEREKMLQEVQTLQENIMNSSVVRENLESHISDKESALIALKDKYATLEAAFEEISVQKENTEESLKTQLNELTYAYEEKINNLNVKTIEKDETEMKLKALNDKYCVLETDFDKVSLEHKLVAEAQRLEIDDLHKKHEHELNEARTLVYEKNQELEIIRQEIDSYKVQFEKQMTQMQNTLREIEGTLSNKISDNELETSKILKDCENKVEMKIKESEIKFHYTEEELRQVTHHRDKLRISNMNHQLTIVELQDKIDTLVTELNATRESYEADLAFVRNEHNVSKRQCKKLNIGIGNIQASLEALRKRLLESENDVEEMTKAFHQVKAQKAAADEQIKILTQELETVKESMTHLESDTVNQIEEVRSGLLNKLEEFRMKAEKNVTAKEEEILEHRHQIEELSTRIFELTETLSAVEETNSEHEHEIEALTEKLDHQRKCAQFATQQIAKLDASNAIYQHQIQALTNELDYQKDFSQQASDHIAAIAAVKTNQEREISALTAKLKAEKEMVLKLSSETQETKEQFVSYKEEFKAILQNYHCDCKTGGERSSAKEICQHQINIEDINPDVRGLKELLDSAVEFELLEMKQDLQRYVQFTNSYNILSSTYTILRRHLI